MNNNPILKSYIIVFEQTNKTKKMCILSLDVVENIHIKTNEGVQSLSLLFNVQGISSPLPKNFFS
jgi:hypothetical protein